MRSYSLHRRPVGLTFICCESTNVTPRVINAEQSFMEAMNDLDRAATMSEGSQATWIHTALEEKGQTHSARCRNMCVSQFQSTKYTSSRTTAPVMTLSEFELMHNGDALR